MKTDSMIRFTIILVTTLSVLVNSKKIHIQIRDNVTQSCPNVDSNVIDESSVKISMKMLKNSINPNDDNDEDNNEVTVTDVNGETRSIDFPGCYLVKISFKLLKKIENPYIEAFMQLGQNLPCKNEEMGNTLKGVDSICANVTHPVNWCPESFNSNLRDMLDGKNTCRFCQLCENTKLKENESKLGKIKKFISTETEPDCSVASSSDLHHYSFKMCTPSKEEMNQQQDVSKDKIQEYWEYLKQGIMTTVIHVMNRNPIKNGRAEQCQKMCSTLFDDSISSSYKTTLETTIERLCAPVDTYAACLYHTVKFDVNTNV